MNASPRKPIFRASLAGTPGGAARGGCQELVARGAKALLISLLAGFVGLIVGGDELRGVAVAFVTVPAVFLLSFIYFSWDSRRKALKATAAMTASLRRSKNPRKDGSRQ